MRLRQAFVFMVLFMITFVMLQTNVVLDQNFYRATRITLVIVELIIVTLGIRQVFKTE